MVENKVFRLLVFGVLYSASLFGFVVFVAVSISLENKDEPTYGSLVK